MHMEKLSTDEMLSLEKIVKSIQESVNKLPELQRKLNLKDKLGGVIGEAIGLTKLFEIYRDTAKYKWHGKMQEGFDVIVTKNGKSEKIQIKASAEKEYMFRVAKVSMGGKENAEKVKQEVLNKKPVFVGIFERIDKAIDRTKADKWLLVHVKEKANDFYFIEKEGLKEIIKKHYQNAVETRDHTKSKKQFNAYIDKTYVYHPILTQKRDSYLLEKYKI